MSDIQEYDTKTNTMSASGNVSIKYKDFQYKVTGKENKNTTVEILIIVKLKNENN